MDDIVTEFRTIDGIGEAIERRLHAAGVESWRQLAQITVALAAVRDVSSRRLRDIAKEADRRADATDGESHPSEHTESFVVRVHLKNAAGVLRTHATDTRTGEEQRWQGWAPEELGDFIASHAGITGRPAPHRRRKVIPIGRVVGGTSRHIEAELELEPHTVGQAYRAELAGRTLGAGAPLMGPLAIRRGAVPAAASLELDFDEVTLPAGVVDLVVALELDTALIDADLHRISARRRRYISCVSGLGSESRTALIALTQNSYCRTT